MVGKEQTMGIRGCGRLIDRSISQSVNQSDRGRADQTLLVTDLHDRHESRRRTRFLQVSWNPRDEREKHDKSSYLRLEGVTSLSAITRTHMGKKTSMDMYVVYRGQTVVGVHSFGSRRRTRGGNVYVQRSNE